VVIGVLDPSMAPSRGQIPLCGPLRSSAFSA